MPGGGGASGPERVLDRVATRLRRFDSADLAASNDDGRRADLAETLDQHARRAPRAVGLRCHHSLPPPLRTAAAMSARRGRAAATASCTARSTSTRATSPAAMARPACSRASCRTRRAVRRRSYVDPEPEDLRDHTDHFGNVTTYFHVSRPHTRLTVTATSLVDVTSPVLPAGVRRLSPGRRCATRWRIAPVRTPRRGSTSWLRRSSVTSASAALRRGVLRRRATRRRGRRRPGAPHPRGLPLQVRCDDRDDDAGRGPGAPRGRLPGLRAPRGRVPALDGPGRPLRQRLPRDVAAAGAAQAASAPTPRTRGSSVLVPGAGWVVARPDERPARRRALRHRRPGVATTATCRRSRASSSPRARPSTCSRSGSTSPSSSPSSPLPPEESVVRRCVQRAVRDASHRTEV